MRRYVGAFLSIVVVAAIGIAVVVAVSAFSRPLATMSGSDQGTAPTSQGTLKHVALTLQTFPFDPYLDPEWISNNVTGKTNNGFPFPSAEGDNASWVKYWPTTNLVVPAHALVTITIQNYDSATPLLNPYYAVPRGITGPMTVDGQAQGDVDPNNVSHTFTIHSIPYANNQPWLFVSVPLTAVSSTAKTDSGGLPLQPVVTQFSFITGAPGNYIWQCFDPCGSGFNGFGGPMATKGYMSGTFTVQ